MNTVASFTRPGRFVKDPPATVRIELVEWAPTWSENDVYCHHDHGSGVTQRSQWANALLKRTAG